MQTLDIVRVQDDIIMSEDTFEYLVSCMNGRKTLPDKVIDEAVEQCFAVINGNKDPNQLELFNIQANEV